MPLASISRIRDAQRDPQQSISELAFSLPYVALETERPYSHRHMDLGVYLAP